MISQNVMHNGVVKIVKNQRDNYITPFYNDEYGFIDLSTERLVNGKLETVTCKVKGTIELLERYVQARFQNGTMNGTIVIQEFLESQVPDSVKKANYGNRPYEKAIAEFLKINSATGLPIIIEGQRVVRFAWPVGAADFVSVESLLVEYHPPVHVSLS